MVYDSGVAAGPGALTQMGLASGASNEWSGAADAFSRVSSETNSTFQYPAYGHVNGQSILLSAWLDNQPASIAAIGTNAMQWRAMMDLAPGAHQLKVSALHPSGFYTAWTTNSFTNTLAYQSTADSYDAAGNITNRVWKNPSGTVERTQTLSWDARGRLHGVTDRDANNSGYNWSAVYDPLNRRLQTTTVLVTNGVASTAPPQTISSYFDPQVEFLELGVSYGDQTIWKLYGPDMNGRYGGLNGTGGLDGVSPYLDLFYPTISDFRGNILAEITNGMPSWIAARPTGYGAVPGYRPAAFANGTDMAQSSAWRGREVDVTGYYNIGLRPYDPVSGRWLTFDSVWNERDPNYYSFAGGEPIMGFDPDGRLGKQFYQTTVQQANAVMGWTDDTIINTIAGAGYLADSTASFVTGDPGFASAAQQWQSEMSPYAKQGYYNQTAPVAQIASAGVMFVDPESAAGNVESTFARDAGESSVITDPARLLPETSSASTATSPSFYVTADGTVIPATGYRAVGGPAVESAEAGNIMSKDPQTYVTFTDISGMSGSEAGGVLQLKNQPSHYATFDTLQIIDDLSIPGGRWGASPIPEPITSTFPGYGIGGATQATTKTPILNYTLQPFTK
jgi:RHS repeat-associated protein